MNRQLARACLVTCVVAVVVSLVTAAANSAAPSRTPAVVGVVQTAAQWTLAPLDPRTLEPVRGAWTHRLREVTALVRSPRGTAVVVSGRRTIFLDTRTGRPLRRSSPLQAWTSDVYWVGGERVVSRGRASIYAMLLAGWPPDGEWYHYVDLAGPDNGAAARTEPLAILPTGMLVEGGEGSEGLQLVRWPHPAVAGGFLAVTRVNEPVSGPFAADTLHDRVFAVADDGTVAEINRISRKPQVTYHHVDLNGGHVQWAGWAGEGTIAICGQDGLATIDTLTWTTRAVDATARSALVTPHGIVAWTYGEPGVRVYRPDGTLRFAVLQDERIRWPYGEGELVPGLSMPVVVGRYLYIAGDTRASVDLISGRVVGRPRPDATVAAPTLVPIP